MDDPSTGTAYTIYGHVMGKSGPNVSKWQTVLVCVCPKCRACDALVSTNGFEDEEQKS